MNWDLKYFETYLKDYAEFDCKFSYILFLRAYLLVYYISTLDQRTRALKDKYPNFEVGLKCILAVNPYLLVCSYIK